MSDDRADRLQEVFLGAADLEGAAREAYLSEACGGDEALRREVRALLSHDHAGEDVLSTPLVDPGLLARDILGGEPGVLPEGSRVGGFTVDRMIGSGGMGDVYLAHQERPRRTVALKVVRPGLYARSLHRRFEREAEILGKLQHPGIAQIFEAGTWERGPFPFPQSYIAMEYIDGVPLTEHARSAHLAIGDVLALMAAVCDAVHYAHQRGVIHRDLKPANILVTREGRPKVLDFGVARMGDGDLGTMHTHAGQIIGTLAYMSPEQVAGDTAAVDVRSDVYSLGVILYELLSGRLPHDLSKRPLPEAARIIRDDAPASLSTIDRSLRGDLETIVATAMQKDPDARYASAGALAEDIRRHLAGEPIAARADSALYLLRKSLNRYRGIFAATAAAAAALAVVTAYALREQAKAEARAEMLRRQGYIAQIGFVTASIKDGDPGKARELLALCPEDLRGWEWRYLSDQCDTSIAQVSFFGDWINSTRVTPRGVLAQRNGERWRFTTPDGQRTIAESAAGETDWAWVSEEGDLATRTTPELLRLVDLATGQDRWSRQTSQPATVLDVGAGGVFVAGGGAYLLLGVEDGGVRWTYTATGQFVMARISPDGTKVAAGNRAGDVLLLDAATGSARRLGVSPLGVRSLCFRRDSSEVAVGGMDGSLRVWSVDGPDDGPPRLTATLHDNKVSAVAFSEDGSLIATGSTDNRICIVDSRSGERLSLLIGHTRTVIALGFQKGGAELASCSLDGVLRTWDLARVRGDSFRIGESLIDIALDGELGRLVFSTYTDRAHVFDARSLAPIGAIPLPAAHSCLDVVPGTGRAAIGCGDGTIQFFDLGTGARGAVVDKREGLIVDIDWWPARSWILASSDDGEVRAYTKDGARAWTWKGSGSGLTAVAGSEDGSLIAVGARDGSLVVVRVADGSVVRRIEGLGEFPWETVLTRDGSRVFVASANGDLWSYPLPKGEPTRMPGHSGGVFSLSLSEDGTRLVSGGYDNTVRLWDVESGTELLPLRWHTGSVHALLLTRDGIYSGADDGRMRVWRTRGATSR